MSRVYRLLLLLYPAGFRREYGAEMAAIFAERAARTGVLGRPGLLFEALGDVLRHALPLHPVRLALGAEPASIGRRVVRDGMLVVLIGLVPGLVAALAAGRLMRALLFGVSPLDPVTILLTVTVCVAMALSGAWVPTLRASRVSPMSVMRAE